MNTPEPNADIARYLPVSPEDSAWGVMLRGFGRITTALGSGYPPAGHPGDHAFTWKHGRVLGAWQLVLVTSGGGECEFDRGGGIRRVPAGSVIIVVPGQWHRYRPSPDTGWSEHWLEFDGEVPRRLTEAGRLPRRGEVRVAHDLQTLLDQWEALWRNADDGGHAAAPAAELAAGLLRLLGLLTSPAGATESPARRAVRRAEHILATRLDNPPTMPALAREVGVSYAVFRREFGKRTGLSPRRYQLNLRLEHARRLIGHTPLRLEAVAEQTGFSSAFHLSAAFKKHFGVTPATWRAGRI